MSAEVIKALTGHSLISPVHHGARVVMPSSNGDEMVGDTETGPVPTCVDSGQIGSAAAPTDASRLAVQAIDVYDDIDAAAFA
jgi:hypothetical protein